MQKIVFIAVFLLFSFALAGQTTTDDSVDVEIHVGDSLEIGNCPDSIYKHLDYYRKTRWTGHELPYDTATGSGFYKSFFTTGDFNVEELTEKYKGQRFVIIGLEILTHKETGQPLHIVYLRGPDPNSVIWVDFYQAVDALEIKFLR